MPLSLIIPCFSGNDENIRRTIDSCFRPLPDFPNILPCDDLVIIHSSIFPEDKESLLQLTRKVVVVDWNFLFIHGFGAWMNMGTPLAQNDWCLLLGVSETIAEMSHQLMFDLPLFLPDAMFRCNHDNDPNTWKRIWNKTSGVHWSGLIHEELVGGRESSVVFRMQDYDKTPHPDPFHNEVFKWMKVLTYAWNYYKLMEHPELLGGTNVWWLDSFIAGAKDTIRQKIIDHQDMINVCLSGDLPKFLDLVREKMDEGKKPAGCNFDPLGQPMSEGA